MSRSLSRRISVARSLFALIQLGPAVAAFTLTYSISFRLGELNGSLLLAALNLAAAVIFVYVGYSDPHLWPTGPLWTWGFAVSISGFLDIPYKGLPLAVTALTVLVIVWPLGHFARRLVLSRPVHELADSPLKLTFRSPAQYSNLLKVAPDYVQMHASLRKGNDAGDGTSTEMFRERYDLTRIRVEPHTIGNEKFLLLPGPQHHVINLRSGPAVLIRVPIGEWIFPTKQQERIVELLRLRISARRRELDMKDLY